MKWLSVCLLRSASLAVLLAVALGGRASADVCPNEVVRGKLHSTALPDCRAYELVTPIAKNGWHVEVPYLAGTHLLATSLGGFAGSRQAAPTSFYDIERSPPGWMSSPFVEPFGYTNAAFENLEAASHDLGSGIFDYKNSSASDPRERSFYMRNLPDGSPVEVGPLISPMALASNPVNREASASEPSVSGNLARLVYAIEGPGSLGGGSINYLWPGDTTVEDPGEQAFVSLYEYAGTGNSMPTLVGVDSNDHQISQCGTSLGFPFRARFTRFADDEVYNAISADGSRVFFTTAAACALGTGPPVNELFARISREETIPISEPSYPLAQGSGLGPEECSLTCEAAKPSEGIFQGASEDGSKVFFLSGQPLLNSDNDTELDLYMAEIEGVGKSTKLVRLVQISHDPTSGEAAEVQGVARVSEDGSHVYYVAKGRLTSKPRGGGCLASLSSTELIEEEATKEGSCRPKKEANNLYVYDRETKQTAFIGTLSAADAEDWMREDNRPVDATPDGAFLVFTSSALLTPDDTSSVPQVFEYSAQTETLVRVSAGQSGFNDDGNTAVYEASISYPRYRNRLNPAPQPTSVSDDGAYVVFQSADNLTPQAASGYNNVYEYHAGQVSLISDGQDRTVNAEGFSNVSLVGVDASGEDIVFMTADQLVPQDGDTQVDVYDARINGGLTPSASAPTCEGDGCQGMLTLPPSPSTVASADQTAGEQVVEASPKSVGRIKTKPRMTPRPRRRVKHAKGARHRPRASAGGKKAPR